MDSKTKHRRAALAKKLAAVRAELEGPRREFSALVTAPGANTTNAHKVKRLQDEIEKLTDRADDINREIDAIDQAEIIKVAKSRKPPETERSIELAKIKEKLTEQQSGLEKDLDHVREKIADQQSCLSPSVLLAGGDPLAIIEEIAELRAREVNITAAIDAVSGAIDEAGKQIWSIYWVGYKA